VWTAAISYPFLAGTPLLAQNEAPFTQEATPRGCTFSTNDNRSFGTGVAFIDLDNDADPDLVVLGKMNSGPTRPYTVGVFENVGGTFLDRSASNGIPLLSSAASVCAADYDDDGDLDLFIGCWLSSTCLLRNDGGFRFTDVTAAMGVVDDGAAQGACWGDYNNDGWLDLYLCNRTGSNYPSPPFPISTNPNRLFRNNAGKMFTEVALAEGVQAGNDPSFQASFFDFDRDGDADLYLSNDKGLSQACAVRNRMWKNVAGSFVDISEVSGANGCIDAMCVAIGDWNRDRLPDLYITNLPAGNYLYVNQGNGTFLNRAAQHGLLSQRTDWGAVFVDYNNDAREDLYVCENAAANRLFRQGKDGVATDVAPTMGITDPGATYCCAAADIDNDGDLDIAAVNVPFPPIFVTGQLRLYINHEGERRSFVKFRVVGRSPNRFGVGAQVDIRTAGQWQMREVVAGSNFKAQNDLTLHFGLDQAARVDEIRVKWPGDGTGYGRTLRNYPAGRTWSLYPDERLGDADADADLDSADFFAFLDRFLSFTGTLRPGDEIFDMDSDGSLTSTDFFDFLVRMFS
jgi:hypothetical protein